MPKEKLIGLVIEELPNLQFKVKLPDEKIIRCYTAGKIKIAHIKIMINDKVEVDFDPSNGGEIGRIIWRL